MILDQNQQPLESITITGTCDKIKAIEVIGLHKLISPKTSYRYVFLVTLVDGSQMTIYRKYKEVKLFQAQLSVDASNSKDQRDASRYLNKLKRKTRPGIVPSSLGTAQRLRLIDSLNTYFEAVTHYFCDVEELQVLKDFLTPSADDLDASRWSKNGKTYFYTSPTSSLRQNDDKVTKDVAMKRWLSSTNLLSVQMPKEEYRRKSRSMILSTEEDMDEGVYIADEDHIPREEDASHNVIALKRGEKVQVIRKSETGWWYVKKINEFTTQDSCGYVPASFLKFCMRDNVFNSVSTMSSSCSNLWLESRPQDPVYETICFPTNGENNNRPLPETPLQKSMKCKLKSPYLSLKNYKSQNHDELSFEKDELIDVIQKNSDGWWLARHKGEEGFVPATFITKYTKPSFNSALRRTKFEEIFARKI